MTSARSRQRQYVALRKAVAFLLVCLVPNVAADPATLVSQPTESPKAATTADTRTRSLANAPSQRQLAAARETASPNVAADIEISRRFNDLRRELLDGRAKTVDWWLTATAIFLTLLGIIAVVAGYLGFRRFREIEAEARGNVESSRKHAEEARNLVDEIKVRRDEADAHVKGLTAEAVHNEPSETRRAAESVQKNPTASPIDHAVATAVLLQQSGNIEEAIEQWRAVAVVSEITDKDLSAQAWFSVGYLHQEHKEGTLETVIDAYDKAIRLKPALAEAYSNRGIAKSSLGHHEEILADFDEAIRLKPDYAGAYSNRGAAKNDLGRHEEALADFDEAIRLKSDYPEAYNNRGNAKSSLGRHEEALADYDEAIRLKPDLAEAYNNRGTAKNSLGRHEEALTDFDEVIRLKPDLAEAYSNRGAAKNDLGRHEEALADYDKAVRLKPGYAEAYNNRGAAKNDLGRHEEALADYDKAIRLKPDYAEAYYNRGKTNVFLDRTDEARRDFETAVSLARNARDEALAKKAEHALKELSSEQDP